MTFSVLGLLAVSAQAAHASTLGKTTIGASNGGGLVANAKRVNAYQLSVPASVSKLDIYLSPSGTAGSEVIEGVIYADAGGAPGALVAQSQQISFSSTSHAGWYDLPMASAVTLSPGTYWLGIYTGATSAVAAYRYDAGSSNRARLANNQTYAKGNASNPFGAVGWSDTHLMSLYATYRTPSWTTQSLPDLGVSNGQLAGVSCPSITSCTAVGDYQTSSGATTALAATWNSSSWSIPTTPHPPGATSTSLNAVSCSSSTACTAVGSYQTSSGTTVTLGERWNGTSWSIQTTLNPTGAANISLNGVACPSTTTCLAVGYSADSTFGQQHGLVERWNGTGWSISTTPAFGRSDLTGISCTSTTACTAVGEVTTSASSYGSLVERWNGTAWSVQASAPAPAGSYGTPLYGVSCASTVMCFAVGSVDYIDPTPLAERWDGKTWTITDTSPLSSAADVLLEVSCGSTTACITVGSSSTPVTTVRIVGQWNGTGWSSVTTPGPADGQMLGVSCSSPIACTAVGSIGVPGVPLVQRYP